MLRLGLILVYERSSKDIWKTPLERLHVAALTPNKTGCPHQPLAPLPTIHQPEEAEAGSLPVPSHSLHLLWLKHQHRLPLERLGPASIQFLAWDWREPRALWENVLGEGGRAVGKRGWENERGQRKLLINTQLREPPCQERSLTPKLPKGLMEELLSELQASVLSCS